MTEKPMKKGGLGRGLGALIPSSNPEDPSAPRKRRDENSADPDRTKLGNSAADVILGNRAVPGAPAFTQETSATLKNVVAGSGQELGATYEEIPIGEIAPNDKNPRQVFDEEELSELVHSIKEFGLLQPIVVRPAKDGYELIMGERRWRAASKAGVKTIPAIVRATSDANMLRDALLENIHRVQLNPLEEAAAYQQLLEEFEVTQSELADRLGRSRPVITNTIRLLALPVPVQRRVAAGVLSAGHARAIMGVKTGASDQEALADRVVREGLSVRATEEAATLINRGDAPADKPRREPTPTPEFATAAAERLADSWDTRVSVQMGKKKGKIVVEFGDRDDLERIMGLIEGN